MDDATLARRVSDFYREMLRLIDDKFIALTLTQNFLLALMQQETIPMPVNWPNGEQNT
jgi:hypothetical protein